MSEKKKEDKKPAPGYGAKWVRTADDNYTGEDCDAARDYYSDHGGTPVTERDWEEDRAWEEECRRNRW